MISPRFSKGLLLSLLALVIIASSLADTIGDAKVMGDANIIGFNESRTYPIIADDPGHTGGDPGRTATVRPPVRISSDQRQDRRSAILADIVKKLRPLFEDAKRKSIADLPGAPTQGKAIEFPKHGVSTFIRAAQESAASQRLGLEMARRLGRKYLRVEAAEDEFAFGGKGAFYGKLWDELLQDPYLGIDPSTLELVFIFGPRH